MANVGPGSYDSAREKINTQGMTSSAFGTYTKRKLVVPNEQTIFTYKN